MTQETSNPPPKERFANKPLTADFMKALSAIMVSADVTRTELGEQIGQPQQTVSEWLTGFRAAPGSEPLLEMIRWAYKKDRKSVVAFLAN